MLIVTQCRKQQEKFAKGIFNKVIYFLCSYLNDIQNSFGINNAYATLDTTDVMPKFTYQYIYIHMSLKVMLCKCKTSVREKTNVETR